MLRDHYRGVSTTYQPKGKNHYPLLVRDARPQKYGYYQREASYYDYAILGLNYLSGLIDLLEMENERRERAGISERIDIDEVKQDFSRPKKDSSLKKPVGYAQQYYELITPENDTEEELEECERLAEQRFGRFFHSVILPYYQSYFPDLSEKEAKNNLRVARDFANMKLETYAVATISRTNVVPIGKVQSPVGSREHIDTVELELPLVKLTEAQIEMYRNRKNLPWYKCQSETAKALIDKYVDRIIEGRMIPAQLIYHLIGTRNGYEKVTTELNPHNEDHPDPEQINPPDDLSNGDVRRCP